MVIKYLLYTRSLTGINSKSVQPRRKYYYYLHFPEKEAEADRWLSNQTKVT